MAAVIATERRLRTRMPGRELVVQNVVNWRTVRGYGELWRGRADWVGGQSRKPGGCRESTLRKSGIRVGTRQTNPAYFYKQTAGSKKRWSITLHLKGPLDPP